MGLWDSFCGDTTLHGYQYIGRFGENVIELFNLFKKEGEKATLVLCRVSQHRPGSVLPLVQHCRVYEQVLNMYMKTYSIFVLSHHFSFTTTSLLSTTSSLDNIFYPSVTVCNMNQIR